MKECKICVYNGVCEDRKDDVTITDCCIVEEPLRRLQKLTHNVYQFAEVTAHYIRKHKLLSVYWSNELRSKNNQ